MRFLLTVTLALVFAVVSPLKAQMTPSSNTTVQTARQALIELLLGEAPDHIEKHLPDLTMRTLDKIKSENSGNAPAMFSALAARSKAGKEKIETFDTGPMLFTIEGFGGLSYEKIYATVERDEMVGDEDRIELALHLVNQGKEEALLPMILHFLFSMKVESGIWRLNEVSATARFPLADQTFLTEVEKYQLNQNEQLAQWSVRAVVSAEKSYQAAQGGFACTLSDLGSAAKGTGASRPFPYLYDSQVAGGKKNGYRFAISGCDTSHYRVVAEPEAPDAGQRAFCSDETGKLRASVDGKGSTCLTRGEVVEDKLWEQISGGPAQVDSKSPLRVRVSQGVANGLLISKVQPVYPPEARQARIQGSVVMKALINQTGDVTTLDLVSGHPMLAPAAMEAVKQWKYKPFLLNGNAVNVETQITVNFELSEH
ncbi:MAG TPA: energy transducer TonB [Terriglobales bacterium]|nr:energy transducer TonB [Terriglobales bacterium]